MYLNSSQSLTCVIHVTTVSSYYYYYVSECDEKQRSMLDSFRKKQNKTQPYSIPSGYTE